MGHVHIIMWENTRYRSAEKINDVIIVEVFINVLFVADPVSEKSHLQ